MPRPLAVLGQIAAYALFAVAIGYGSTAPRYRQLAPDEALLRLSFTHPGRTKADCRRRTPEELAKLPPNMRAPIDCPRERSPVVVRVALDGVELYHLSFRPAGLERDGASTGYRRTRITAGPHRLEVQFNDDVRVRGYTHERTALIDPRPGQIVLVDFDPGRGGVIIR
jgi:hypothetical protein